MNVILLSGGSGKRLWPLSNSIRSKQFVRLLNHNGKYESMLQRVYRQILKIDPSANVVVATGQSQVNIIRNQLGKDIPICIEPSRRDTFPAIALASLYLRDKLNINETETVIVCPVDPYVDDSYFEGLYEISKIVNNNSLYLMGIEPSYPSEKFGYIIPATDEKVSEVLTFKEKPTKEKAKEYIKEGALWNSGVFAFKLNYIINRINRKYGYIQYSELLSGYDGLEKISFDYAVVEYEQRIKVMRYCGFWQDIGTWDSMTKVIPTNTIGSAILDESSTNSYIINNLNVPVIGVGCEDTVIVASQDGILVSNIESSETIKQYVENVEISPMIIEMEWGTQIILDNSKKCQTKKITINSDKCVSDYITDYYEESWTVLEGAGEIQMNNTSKKIGQGDVFKISKETKFSLFAQSVMTVISIGVWC